MESKDKCFRMNQCLFSWIWLLLELQNNKAEWRWEWTEPNTLILVHGTGIANSPFQHCQFGIVTTNIATSFRSMQANSNTNLCKPVEPYLSHFGANIDGIER